MMKEYLNKKFVESLIYDTKIQLNQTSTQKKLNIEFLKKLNTYLKQEQINKTIDEKVKTRTFEIINYIRFNMGKNQDTQYNEELNDIIRKLNRIENHYCLNFYYNQLNARAHNSDELSYEEKKDQISKYYNIICCSISYDYKVLSDIIRKQEEYKKIMPKYIGDAWFLSSINGMYKENSKIFREKRVLENTLNTIEQNENLITFDNTLKEHNKKIKLMIER